MASRKKQRLVVVNEDGVSVPAADHPPVHIAPPKLGRRNEGGMAGSTAVEMGKVGKPNMNPGNRSPDGLPPDSLSPDSICKGIKVTLDNNSMWNEFYKCRTEMILTKQGCRMFPYCRFRISGLQPSKKYSLIMDIQPLDNSRYRWTGKNWLVSGEAESPVKSAPFCHPESPSTGQHWMQNPVSFYKLKLTNNIADQEGNAILYPMHRYLPRLHLVQTDKPAKAIKLNGPAVLTFTFPQTEFMAVTGYQNSRFAQLKVDYNPFAKGLKEDGSGSKSLNLKLNSRKDPLKEEGTTANELHPVKKSLKSLLANHKPRNLKTPDPKPSVSCDLQNHCTTNRDQSAAKSTGESSRSPPAQKLFSELIREAHVSLQRCSLQQLSINNSNNIHHKTEQPNTNNTAETLNRPEDNKSVKALPEKTDGDSVSKKKGRQDLPNSPDHRDNISSRISSRTSPSLSVDSDRQQKSEAPSEEKAKQHKRPAPLPLPALALFLKQHSTKSKKNKSRPDSPPRAPLPEPLRKPPNSAENVPPHLGEETGVSLDLREDSTEPKNQTDPPPLPNDKVCSVHNQAIETRAQPSSPLSQDTSVSSDANRHRNPDLSCSDPQGRGPELADSSPMSPSSDQPLSSIISSSHTTSSPSQTTSCHPVLPVQESLLSDPLCIKSDSLLPDPECSSFSFEPMSPASSPEPLPSLPVSFTLELDSTTAEPTQGHPEEFGEQNTSSASVFKWHTVLPPPEHYNNTSFSTFQATPDSLPLASVTSPVLPSENPPFPEPKSLDPSTPPPEDAPSFEVNEQALPFPAELSPLALQLPLSPTFSLDGEGLSPTPSLTDLVHLFSIDVDLGMGVEFSNSEMGGSSTCLSQSISEADAQEVSKPTEVVPAKKPGRPKKKCRQRKVTKTNAETVNSTVNTTASSIDSPTTNSSINSSYVLMQPNLEEVEEQLFVSFTSKEALKLHVVDSLRAPVCQPQTTPEAHLQPPADSPEQVEAANSLEEKVASLQMVLLKDLKRMRHRQVIHPVLQEVGLKMNLLDPTQAVDLKYLGVRLPIPPPGASIEPVSSELSQSKGVCGAFTSRTGKTTDVTQIKGWREKFITPEAPPPPAVPEGGPSSDTPKKNLSAFCSDMLDEYLENEGKLIDQRADSFSQPQLDPPVYQLPTTSTSYVRTLDSILKKQPAGSPTSDLISGFVPPSKRPKPSPTESKIPRGAKRRGPKPFRAMKPRQEPESAPTSISSLLESNLVTKQPVVQTPSETHHPLESPPPTDPSAPVVKPTRRKHHPRFQSDTPHPPEEKKRRRLKSRNMSQSFDPSSCTDSRPAVSEDLAPLESDSELGDENHDGVVITRTLLRQKDLEDAGVWEGQPRARITEERASIALTSLFTLKGFVTENPTKPVQLVQRRAPPCLNEFCRLGCVCSSLAYTSRVSHCGRPACMLGCSCLKQKVVLLKNLEPDSSPSHQENRKRRKRRMKMAYVLKEADSVTQPAERVQTLWKKDSKEPDPDPIQAPKRGRLPSLHVRTKGSSCARARVYQPKKRDPHQKEKPKDRKFKDRHLKKPKDPQGSNPPTADGPDQLVLPPTAESVPPEAEPTPKPSKRLIILAEGKWGSDTDRSHVLKQLCERMARDQLDQPFWVWGYRIAPIGQTVEGSGPDRCIQYRVHISKPEPGPETQTEPGKSSSQETSTGTLQQQDHLKQVSMQAEPADNLQREMDEEPLEDWQREVEEDEEDEEPLEDWQREVEEDEEPLEDWQREVEEEHESEEEEEEAGSTHHQVHVDPTSGHTKGKEKKMFSLGLPWLTGVSPAGFLSTNRKQPGGTDYLVQVNGKLYPLAKIQLGQMGALHPANRLAAYLTGRVGSSRKQPDSSKPPQNQNLNPTPHTATTSASAVTAPPPKPQPSVPVLTIKTAPPEIHTPIILHQSAEGGGQKVIKFKLYPCQAGGANQIRMIPETSVNPTPPTDKQVGPPLGQNPVFQGLPLMVVPAQGPSGKLTVRGPTPLPANQRMILKPVQTASGAQYFRRPDGKLVQLFPISQLRPVNPGQTLTTQRVLTPTSCQTPSLPVGGKPPPQTSLHPLAVTSLPTPNPVPHPAVAKKPTCNIKIFPSDPTKEPLVVTCVKVPPPPPVKVLRGSTPLTQLKPPTAPKGFLSLTPSTGGGAEPGVKRLTVGPGGVIIHQTPQVVTQPPPPAPPRSEVTRSPPSQPVVERVRDESPDLMDLDVMCEETEVSAAGGADGAKSGQTKNSPNSVEETQSKTPKSKSSKDNGPVQESTEESSETESSSDSDVDTDGERTSKVSVKLENSETENSESEKITDEDLRAKKKKCLEARQQRKELSQLFNKLGKELELKEKPTRATVLNKAVHVIQELRKTETNLTDVKRQLIKKNNFFLNLIVPPTERKHTDMVEMKPLSDLKKENFSEEDRVVKMETNMGDSGAHSISTDQLSEDQGNLPSDTSCKGLKYNLNRRLTTMAFKALRSVLNSNSSRKEHLLKQAHREIQSLQCEMTILKRLKSCLKKQRDAYLKKLLQRSAGRNELKISGKHPSPKETSTANQLPASEGGGVSPSTGEDDLPSSSHPKQQQQQQQASKTPPDLTPPTTTPAPVPVPLLAPPTSSHLTLVPRDRARTVPNILSRSKKKVMESPPIQAPAPQVLSLFGAPFPGQPVLTMSPLMSRPTATPAPADVVTLNITGLTNQQIHLTPVLAPQTGKIYGSPKALTITNLTNLTAPNVNNLLELVPQTGHQPTSEEQQHMQQHQTHEPAAKEPKQQQANTKQQKQTEQQTTQQQQLQPATQKQEHKETKDQLPQISQSQDAPFKQDSDSVGGTEDSVGGVTDMMVEPGDSLGKGDNSDDSLRGASGLTSLLHEIDFLNQKNSAARTEGLEAELQEESDALDEALDQGEPWMLQLDSDSEDTVTMETSETEEMRSQVQSGFLAPPPLLQMKVGGATAADPALSELAAGEGGGGDKGTSWKPMPRLVPLGLRGHAPS